jgi:hypothetical protein
MIAHRCVQRPPGKTRLQTSKTCCRLLDVKSGTYLSTPPPLRRSHEVEGEGVAFARARACVTGGGAGERINAWLTSWIDCNCASASHGNEDMVP